MNKKTLVFGHKNPDTDSICSAIAYAHLKQQLGVDAEAVRLGAVNAETEYVLNYFQIDAPRLVETVADEVESVILIDHNERQQSVADIEQVRVMEVIDHHRIANFETSDPLYFRAEPVGCTATIINKLYKEQGIALDKPTAGLMLSAIISDTLLLKSPTCTEQDVACAHELAKIAEVDLEKYGLDMLKAGTDLSDKTVDQLIALDAKSFAMGPYQVDIAQVNAVDPQQILEKQADIERAMRDAIAARKLDLFVFVVTDILTNDSIALALGEQAAAIEEAYGVELVDHKALLKGVVSRKSQIVPILTDVLSRSN